MVARRKLPRLFPTQSERAGMLLGATNGNVNGIPRPLLADPRLYPVISRNSVVDVVVTPLRYLIGLDGAQGMAGALTVQGYDATEPVKVGLAAKYCNLRDENHDGTYGPYLPPDDIDQQYNEPAPDPKGDGFKRNRDEQLDRARSQGFTRVEFDNIDTYDVGVALQCFNEAAARGLEVLCKNPGLVKGDHIALLKHGAVIGIIVEQDAGAPIEMDGKRRAAGKPNLPVWFVAYGDGYTWAERMASTITAHKLAEMGVTYSPNGEYESVENILLPMSKEEPPVMASATPWLTDARADIGVYHDGPDVPRLAMEVAAKFPDLASYCRLASSTTAWCGVYLAAKLAKYGIRPPYNKSNELGSFMWVDSWLKFGTKVPAGQEQPGDIALFLGSPHHCTFVAGGGRYIGGNQGDGVTSTTFRMPDAFRRPPAVGTVPIEPPADVKSGRGSWYSQYEGEYSWVDTGDEPGSNALGVPDDAQGVAFYDQSTLGKWFMVNAPNGNTDIQQQTDIGPHPNTGRLIDISAVAAERYGYTPDDFPTDEIFTWRSTSPPKEVAGLSPQQQAVKYRDLRGTVVVPIEPPVVVPPVVVPMDFDPAQVAKILRTVADLLDKWGPLIKQFWPIILQLLAMNAPTTAVPQVPPKPPVVITPPPTSPLAVNIGAGVFGVVSALGAWWYGLAPEEAAVLIGGVTTLAAAAGIPAPIITGLFGLFNRVKSK